jgi:hypothetical protein
MSNCDFKVVLWEASRVLHIIAKPWCQRLIFEHINALHMSNAYKKSFVPIKKNQNN